MAVHCWGVCPIQRYNAVLPGHDLIFCDTSPIEFQPLRLFKLDRPTIMGSVQFLSTPVISVINIQ